MDPIFDNFNDKMVMILLKVFNKDYLVYVEKLRHERYSIGEHLVYCDDPLLVIRLAMKTDATKKYLESK